MKNAWMWKVSVLGVAMALVGAGCVVGSSDDDNTGGTGGSSASGGSGGSTGGSGGSTGGAAGAGATGGAAGSGGATAAYVCDKNLPSGTTRTPGNWTSSGNNCVDCVASKCKTEADACLATNPNDPCWYGGLDIYDANGDPGTDGVLDGEAPCIQECVVKAVQNGGVADDATVAGCAGQCTTADCGTISGATSELIGCMKNSCLAECLQSL